MVNVIDGVFETKIVKENLNEQLLNALNRNNIVKELHEMAWALV